MSTALLNFIPVKLVNPNPSWNFVFSYLDIFSNEENSKFNVKGLKFLKVEILNFVTSRDVINLTNSLE